MVDEDALVTEVERGYGFEDDAIVLGRALAGDLETPITSAYVQVPLASLNRHGLIAGATGTGKTKTLQVYAEQLSRAGIPVFLACEDLAGDASGAPAGFVPGPMNAELAKAYRSYAALLPELERERTEYDAAEIVELLAERDFNEGGVR